MQFNAPYPMPVTAYAKNKPHARQARAIPTQEPSFSSIFGHSCPPSPTNPSWAHDLAFPGLASDDATYTGETRSGPSAKALGKRRQNDFDMEEIPQLSYLPEYEVAFEVRPTSSTWMDLSAGSAAFGTAGPSSAPADPWAGGLLPPITDDMIFKLDREASRYEKQGRIVGSARDGNCKELWSASTRGASAKTASPRDVDAATAYGLGTPTRRNPPRSARPPLSTSSVTARPRRSRRLATYSPNANDSPIPRRSLRLQAKGTGASISAPVTPKRGVKATAAFPSISTRVSTTKKRKAEDLNIEAAFIPRVGSPTYSDPLDLADPGYLTTRPSPSKKVKVEEQDLLVGLWQHFGIGELASADRSWDGDQQVKDENTSFRNEARGFQLIRRDIPRTWSQFDLAVQQVSSEM